MQLRQLVISTVVRETIRNVVEEEKKQAIMAVLRGESLSSVGPSLHEVYKDSFF